MRVKTLLPLIILSLLTGCSSTKPTEEQRPIMVSQIAGTNIPEGDMERLRYNEDVKAYTVGRYVDPVNSKIMYEKNVLYRVEETPKWNLRPNAEIVPPLGKQPRENTDMQRLWQKEYENEIKKQQMMTKSMVATTKAAVDKMLVLEQQNKALLEKVTAQEQQIKSILAERSK